MGLELDQRETEESAEKICQRDDKEIRKLKKLDPWRFRVKREMSQRGCGG